MQKIVETSGMEILQLNQFFFDGFERFATWLII